MRWYQKIYNKLALLLFMLILITSFTLTFINTLFSRNQVIGRLEQEEIPAKVATIIADLNTTIIEPTKALAVLGNSGFVRQWYALGNPIDGWEDVISRTMQAIVETYGGVGSSFSVADQLITASFNRGQSRATFSPIDLEGSESWYRFLINGTGTIAVSVYTSPDDSAPDTAYVDYRILEGNRFLGHISLGLDISEFISRIVSRTIGQEGRNFVVDGDGVIRIHQDLSLINEATLNQLPGYEQEYQAILGSQSFSGQLIHPSEGRKLVNSVRIPELNWYLITEADEREMLAGLTQAIRTSVLVTLVLLISSVTFGLLFIRAKISMSIRRASNAMEELSQGDADLTKELSILSRDEMGQLARGFNGFLLKLRNLVIQVKGVIDQTDTVRLALSSNTEETSSAVEEISATMGTIAAQIQQLDQSINHTASAIEEITANIESMDRQINDQATMVAQSTSATTQMMASLNSVAQITQAKQQTTQALSSVAQTGRDQIEETATIFKEVVEHIDSIQEMANTINAISSQTNLLSMNAAIEAAHAGDAGRGFSVVAEEIRKLAESAAESSSLITKLIKEITDAVHRTDSNVHKTAQAFDSISQEVTDTVNAFSEINHAIAELNTGGQQILEASEQINGITDNVRQGSSEIRQGTGEMLASAGEIKNISTRVTQGIQEVRTGTEEIVRAIQDIVGLSGTLNEVVSQLKASFGLFRVQETQTASSPDYLEDGVQVVKAERKDPPE